MNYSDKFKKVNEIYTEVNGYLHNEFPKELASKLERNGEKVNIEVEDSYDCMIEGMCDTHDLVYILSDVSEELVEISLESGDSIHCKSLIIPVDSSDGYSFNKKYNEWNFDNVLNDDEFILELTKLISRSKKYGGQGDDTIEPLEETGDLDLVFKDSIAIVEE